jgi:hypothetical protein
MVQAAQLTPVFATEDDNLVAADKIIPIAALPAQITGTMAIGETLSVTFKEGWSADAFVWTRNGVTIAGQTSSTYILTADDLGRTISCDIEGLWYSPPGLSMPDSRYPVAVPMMRMLTDNITYSSDRLTLTATSLGNVTGTTWGSRCLFAEYLEGDGWVSVDNVAGTDCVVAFSTFGDANTNIIANHGSIMRLGRSESGSGLFASEASAPVQLTPTGTTGTFAKGATNKARLRREGTTITIDVSTDSGATWETRYTYPTPRSGRLFVHIHPAFFNPTAYTAVNPMIFRGGIQAALNLRVTFDKVLADGNSLTAVAGPGGGWPAQMNLLPDAIANAMTVTNKAVSGQTISQMLADQATDILPVATDGVVVIYEDRNEFVVNGTSVAITASKIKQYIDALPSAVKTVLVFRGTTVDGSNPASGTFSGDLYTYWMANFPGVADQIVKLSNYYGLSDSSNTTYFNADAVHYTTSGHCVAASAIRDAIYRLDL